jgi:hypothetical protein
LKGGTIQGVVTIARLQSKVKKIFEAKVEMFMDYGDILVGNSSLEIR